MPKAKPQTITGETPEEIAAAYKREYKVRNIPTGLSPEGWALSDEYRAAHQVLIDRRKKAELAEKKDEEIAQKPERLCSIPECENIILPTGKRGRPPTKCEEHRK